MEADGKIKVIHKSGLTKDIIRACVDEWKNGWTGYEEFARQFNRSSIIDSCRAVFDFLVTKIRYKVDPNGEQWIRTPARLIMDGNGDCKSYSILTASVLSCLGIECVMRFVSYDSGDYSHVYVAAFDESGREIKIDAVAYVQCGIQFNNEIDYIKKVDMKGTRISRLSGIGDISVINDERFNSDFAGGQKMNIINCNAGMLYVDLLAQNGLQTEQDTEYGFIFEISREIIEKFGSRNSDLVTAGYVLASYFSARETVNASDSLKLQIITEINSYVTNSVEKAQYIISEKFQAISAPFMAWWDNFIVSCNRTPEMSENTPVVAREIVSTAPFFLYTVIDNNHLPTIALKKKEGQENSLSDFIADSGISGDAALLLVQAGIVLNSEATVVDFFRQLSGKKISIGAIDWDKISNIVSDAADSFSKVYDSVTKGKTSKVPSTIPGYKPETSDFAVSPLTLVLGLGVLGAGIYFLRKKGKKK